MYTYRSQSHLNVPGGRVNVAVAPRGTRSHNGAPRPWSHTPAPASIAPMGLTQAGYFGPNGYGFSEAPRVPKRKHAHCATSYNTRYGDLSLNKPYNHDGYNKISLERPVKKIRELPATQIVQQEHECTEMNAVSNIEERTSSPPTTTQPDEQLKAIQLKNFNALMYKIMQLSKKIDSEEPKIETKSPADGSQYKEPGSETMMNLNTYANGVADSQSQPMPPAMPVNSQSPPERWGPLPINEYDPRSFRGPIPPFNHTNVDMRGPWPAVDQRSPWGNWH